MDPIRSDATLEGLKLIGILFVIPVLSYGVAVTLSSNWDESLRASITSSIKDADPEKVNQLTVSSLCGDPEWRADNGEPCFANDVVRGVRAASVLSIALALFLLGGIRVAGRAALRDRDSILRVFKPGMRITAVLSGLIALINALLLVLLLYFGESYFFGMVHVTILLGLALGGLIAGFIGVKAALSLTDRPVMSVFAKRLAPEEAPELWRHVDELSRRTGAEAPQNIILGLEPTFFVTEGDVTCLDGAMAGRTLYLSLPFCRYFTKEELSAVVGHELGHFVGRDTEYSRKFFPIYRGANEALMGWGAAGGSGLAVAVATMPSQIIMGHFLESFATAEGAISRDRELKADGIGASVASAEAVASALVKLHAYSPVCEDVAGDVRVAILEKKPVADPCALLARRVAEHAVPGSLENLEKERLGHPTDSHPPLSERMSSLGLSVEAVTAKALDVSPAPSALSLIPNGDDLEKRMNETRDQQLWWALHGEARSLEAS